MKTLLDCLNVVSLFMYVITVVFLGVIVMPIDKVAHVFNSDLVTRAFADMCIWPIEDDTKKYL